MLTAASLQASLTFSLMPGVSRKSASHAMRRKEYFPQIRTRSRTSMRDPSMSVLYQVLSFSSLLVRLFDQGMS